ncbi:MAG: ABC transporter permease [Acidobacteria bacterium]|nr:ABC transporter permease [Acidobacteriota bacterium]
MKDPSVISPARGARPAVSVEEAPGASPLGFVRHAAAVAMADLRKLRRDPTEMFTRAVQPLLWFLVFGQVFTRTRVIPTGDLSYLEFMAPGILAQSVLFAAIFYGIAVIWERDLGIVHKMLVSPASRASLVVGKALAAGARGLVQGAMVAAIALLAGVPLRAGLLPVAGLTAAVLLGSALFATFSLVIACIVKTRERFMGIGQVLTMPMFFASNAIYPLDMMPSWLRAVARVNPLTYLVDALRTLMLAGAPPVMGLALDFAVLASVTSALVLLAARLYPGLAR